MDELRVARVWVVERGGDTQPRDLLAVFTDPTPVSAQEFADKYNRAYPVDFEDDQAWVWHGKIPINPVDPILEFGN